MRFRGALLLALLIVGPVAAATPDPASCDSATKAKTAYLKRAGHPGATLADHLLGGDDLEWNASQRESAAEAQMNTLARMCIGDLVADHRFDDAASEALRFGLVKDAEALARAVAKLHAQPPPAP